MGCGASKMYFGLLFWIIGVIVLVDSMSMIMAVAMVVRVGVCMTIGVRMMRMRSRRLMG
jgi:hypothetical protein